MRITANHTLSDIQNQIENGTAKFVNAASFVKSVSDGIEVKFYKLWGEVVKVVSDRSDTTTNYFFVKGEDKEIFQAYYGV